MMFINLIVFVRVIDVFVISLVLSIVRMCWCWRFRLMVFVVFFLSVSVDRFCWVNYNIVRLVIIKGIINVMLLKLWFVIELRD